MSRSQDARSQIAGWPTGKPARAIPAPDSRVEQVRRAPRLTPPEATTVTTRVRPLLRDFAFGTRAEIQEWQSGPGRNRPAAPVGAQVRKYEDFQGNRTAGFSDNRAEDVYGLPQSECGSDTCCR